MDENATNPEVQPEGVAPEAQPEVEAAPETEAAPTEGGEETAA